MRRSSPRPAHSPPSEPACRSAFAGTATWNNPEPEVVLVCAPDGRIVGATLGNDVNLRDWEGRSALLLGRAKDNRSSASIGPFIRLFDSHRGGGFDLDSIRTEDVTLEIEGQNDGFSLRASSSIAKISRDPRRSRRSTLRFARLAGRRGPLSRDHVRSHRRPAENRWVDRRRRWIHPPYR